MIRDTTKFQNRYRIDSARLKRWDYGWSALYYVTVCTKHKVCWFGNGINGKVILSEIGTIAEYEWKRTFEIRPDMNLTMGEFVVMPNHLHMIIGIGDNKHNTRLELPLEEDNTHRRDAMHRVSTPPLSNCGIQDSIQNKTANSFGPQSKNLASIMRGFKSTVTKQSREINPDFEWQERFHDHIIRNEKSRRKIEQYIIDNPASWKEDVFYRKRQYPPNPK